MSPSTSLKWIGGLIVLVGAWSALVPYVGPAFGYPMPPGSEQPAWEWSASHTQRHLIPGLVAILAGGLMWLRSRAAVLTGAGLAVAAGVWFVISPFVPRAWLDGGGGGGGDASTVMQIITPLGYHHIPGLIAVALGAFVLGRLVTSGRAPEAPPARRHVAATERDEREREHVGA